MPKFLGVLSLRNYLVDNLQEMTTMHDPDLPSYWPMEQRPRSSSKINHVIWIFHESSVLGVKLSMMTTLRLKKRECMILTAISIKPEYDDGGT